MQRLLFVRTDRLGETLLTLPAVAALKTTQHEASLTLLVGPELKELLRDSPALEGILAHACGARSLWWLRSLLLGWRLRRQRFDLAVVSNPSKELHLAVWLAGIPRRIGYDRKWGHLLTDRLPDRKALGDRHEVEYNLDLVRVLGGQVASAEFALPAYESEQVRVLQLLGQQGIQPSEPFIVVHPWSSNPRKVWPVDRYEALIRLITGDLAAPVVVIGGKEHVAGAQGAASSGPRVVNLVGRLTLRELAGLLRRARLLISNDSGPAHLAAALKTRTLVLFGTPDPASGPRRWGPWGAGHVVIWKPSMEAITVQEVFEAARARWRSDQSMARPSASGT